MACLHRGPHVQRGRGIGGTLGSIFKAAAPAAMRVGRKILASPVTKDVAHAAKRSALQAGLNVVKDTLSGRDAGESLKENLDTAKDAVTNSLLSSVANSAINTVAPSKKRKVQRPRQKYGDIFS
jgi:hypothetical protein